MDLGLSPMVSGYEISYVGTAGSVMITRSELMRWTIEQSVGVHVCALSRSFRATLVSPVLGDALATRPGTLVLRCGAARTVKVSTH